MKQLRKRVNGISMIVFLLLGAALFGWMLTGIAELIVGPIMIIGLFEFMFGPTLILEITELRVRIKKLEES